MRQLVSCVGRPSPRPTSVKPQHMSSHIVFEAFLLRASAAEALDLKSSSQVLQASNTKDTGPIRILEIPINLHTVAKLQLQ